MDEEIRNALLLNNDYDLKNANLCSYVRYGEDFSSNEPCDYCVYVHICRVEGEDYGKPYIGVTDDIKERWHHGSQYTSNFGKAIEKYGWDNFDHIILINNISVSMADVIEKELIKKFNTNMNNGGFGFNSNNGGIAPKKIYDDPVYQYDTNGIFIQKFDTVKDAAFAISGDEKTLKRSIKIYNGYYATYLWSYEYVDQMEPHLLRYDKYKHKPILQLSAELQIINEYDDIGHVPYKKKDHILKCCFGEQMLSYDYLWVFKSEYCYEAMLNKLKEFKLKYKKVIAYDMNGDYVKTYSSYFEAAEDLNVNDKMIRDVCNKKVKSIAKKYQLRYEDDERPGKYIKKPKSSSVKYAAISTIDNSVVKILTGIREIKEFLNMQSNPQNIQTACAKRNKIAYGYHWRRVDNNGNIIEPEDLKNFYVLTGKVVITDGDD